MSNYALYGTTSQGIPVKVEVGMDTAFHAYRMTVVCVSPDTLGESDPCLFSTDELPAALRQPDPAQLASILDGFGIQTLSAYPRSGAAGVTDKH